MAPRLLRFAEVSGRVGLGRTAIYERIKDERFPPPVKVGAASRWVEAEVDEWIRLITENRSNEEVHFPVLRQSVRLPVGWEEGWEEFLEHEKSPSKSRA